MATKTWQGNGDNWTNGNDWDQPGQPGPGDDVVVASGDPQVTSDVGMIASLTDSASVNLTDETPPGGVTTFGTLAVSGATMIATDSSLNLNNGSTFTTGSLTNDDLLSVSGGVFNGTGGDSLTVNGLLTNTGSIDMGVATFDQRTAGDLMTTQGLSSTGSIYLGGPGANGENTILTEIDVTQQVAGFGTAGVLTGQVSLANNSEILFDGGSITSIGAGTTSSNSGLTLDGTLASISNGTGQNSALTTLNDIGVGSGLSLGDGAVLNLSGNLQNDGSIGLDTFSTSVGGTQLNVAGTLTNTSNGGVTIDAKNGNDTITVGGLSQPGPGANGGNITLYGSAPGAATSHLATLDVTSQAAGFGTTGELTGRLYLSGDALVQFDGGTITTIGGGTSQTAGSLTLEGSLASVSNGGGQNSALAISSVASSSTLDLADGASLTTGNLDNAGSIGLDSYSTDYGTGGTTLTVNGTLTNTGGVIVDAKDGPDTVTTQGLSNSTDASISLDGLNSNLAELNVTDQAAGFGTAGVLTGQVNLYGASSDAVLQFESGGITTIATNSELTLDGANASLQDADGIQNDALTGLTENEGGLYIQDGASLSTVGDVTNTGTISVNNGPAADTLDITGTLTNSGTIDISPGQAAATIDVKGIDNLAGPSGGTINVSGGAAGSVEGLLDVSGVADFGTAGILTGNVNLDNGVIQFASGGITTIASNSELSLEGAQASIQDAGGTQNDALTGLAENDGGLYLEYGASLTTSGNLNNTGQIGLYNGSTNNVLDIGGTLTNSGSVDIDADANNPTIDALGIDNVVGSSTTGSIDVEGAYNNSTMQSYEAELNVSGAAGFGTQGVLTGNVTLGEYGVVQFASGGIGTIAAGSTLSLNSTTASMQDAGGAQNGALTGLSDIAGTLTLQNGSVLATGGAATGAAGTLTVGDTMDVSGRVNATTVDVATGGDLTLSNGGLNAVVTVESGATFAGTGTTYANSVTVAAGGTFNPGGDPGPIATGSLSMASGSTFAVDLGGTPQSGEFGQDSVSGTVSLGGATFSGSLVDGYTPTVGDSFEIISNGSNAQVSGTFAGLAQGDVTDIDGTDFQISYTGGSGGNSVTLTDVGPVCFAAGTLIRTARGDVPVEALEVGDLAVTASGAARPIRWIGKRSLNCETHHDPVMVLPIRVAAGAFGGGRPYRDLLLSPHHAVAVTCVDEVLVPIRRLVNRTTIAQLHDVGHITYWHVELDSHDVILANGLPAESYIDVGNRSEFEGEEPMTLHPLFKSKALAGYCRPLVTSGTVLATIRAQLAGFDSDTPDETAPPAFHLLVEGRRIAPIARGHQVAFFVPAGAREIRLVSAAWSPRDVDPASHDDRRLGLMIESLSLDDLFGAVAEIPLDSPALVAGFHPLESGPDGTWRWTEGDALLCVDMEGPGVVRLTGQFEPPVCQRAAPSMAA